MNKFLLIGDMHVKPDNIEESCKLIEWINNLCSSQNLIPIFMGDQYDTHGNVRVEVLDFWQKTYEKFSKSYSIVGNHDMDYSCEFTSMSSNYKQTVVINKPHRIYKNIIAVPYIKSAKEFTELINGLDDDVKTVLCHQEFYGAQYEGGFYAPTGVKLEEIKKDVLFISGHIHKKQTIKNKNGADKVIYVGTPRQLIRSDIGEIKGVHIYDLQSRLEFIQTPEHVCESFKKISLIQGIYENLDQNLNKKTFIDVYGDEDFIKQNLKKIPEYVKIRTFPSKKTKDLEIKESLGIKNAFSDYFKKYCKNSNLSKEDSDKVLEIIKENCYNLL